MIHNHEVPSSILGLATIQTSAIHWMADVVFILYALYYLKLIVPLCTNYRPFISMLRKISIISIIALIAIALIAGFVSSNQYLQDKITNLKYRWEYPIHKSKFVARLDKNKTITPDMLIAHAGGAIRDSKGTLHTSTNCLQALQQAAEQGYKYIELNLLLDADGDIFAAHDYYHFYKITGQIEEYIIQNCHTPPTKEFIRNAKIHEEFAPLTGADINAFFAKHKDLILVTDKLDNFAQIRKELTFDDERILVEVFSPYRYFEALEAGIKYPMLNIYPLTNENIQQAREQGVNMLTMAAWDIVKMEDLSVIEDYINDGGLIATYTSNNCEFMRQHLGTTTTLFYNDSFNFETQTSDMQAFDWE